jgi:hypothetical protein
MYYHSELPDATENTPVSLRNSHALADRNRYLVSLLWFLFCSTILVMAPNPRKLVTAGW